MKTTFAWSTAATVGIATCVLPASALGQAVEFGGLDSTGIGVAQTARGGAWIARADNPLAVFVNPAALVRQSSGLQVSGQFELTSQCFSRINEGGSAYSPGPGVAGATEPNCADANLAPLPQAAINIRLNRRFALGFGVATPAQPYAQSWALSQDRGGAMVPSGSRYLIVDHHRVSFLPTVGLAVAASKKLAFGLSLSWGMTNLGLSRAIETSSLAAGDDFRGDALLEASAFDAFVPSGTASVHIGASRRFEMAAAFRFGDGARAVGDTNVTTGIFDNGGRAVAGTSQTFAGAATVAEPWSMGARVGVRYRHPRRGARPMKHVAKHRGWASDSMTEDVFDISLDGTWSYRPDHDGVALSHASRPSLGVANATLPNRAGTQWPEHHRLTVHVGGDVVPIPDFLALRWGAYFRSRTIAPQNLSLTRPEGEQLGLAAGLGVRLGRLNFGASYRHTFVFTVDNQGGGETQGVSGDPSTQYLTRQPVNGGAASGALNHVGLSVGYSF